MRRGRWSGSPGHGSVSPATLAPSSLVKCALRSDKLRRVASFHSPGERRTSVAMVARGLRATLAPSFLLPLRGRWEGASGSEPVVAQNGCWWYPSSRLGTRGGAPVGDPLRAGTVDIARLRWVAGRKHSGVATQHSHLQTDTRTLLRCARVTSGPVPEKYGLVAAEGGTAARTRQPPFAEGGGRRVRALLVAALTSDPGASRGTGARRGTGTTTAHDVDDAISTSRESRRRAAGSHESQQPPPKEAGTREPHTAPHVTNGAARCSCSSGVKAGGGAEREGCE